MIQPGEHGAASFAQASPAQRASIQKKLRAYATDLGALAAERAASSRG